MRPTVKSKWLMLMVAALVCDFLAAPAAAEDRYWVNWFGGDWVDPNMINWQTSAGEPGLPGPADRALIVLPYPLVGDQPVFVYTVNPGTSPIEVNAVIIESGNWVSQQDKPYYPRDFPAGYNLNLISDTEIIGGSGETFTAPPGYGSSKPITPKGAHYQLTGTNTVNTLLILGSNAGSEGKYTLSGTGNLSVGSTEKIGSAGTGIFTQSGGSHTVGLPFNPGSLILGSSSPGTGTYTLNDGQLTVMGQEIVGSAGTGTFTQSGGTNATGSLILGQIAGGNGTYNLKPGGTLHATEEIIGSAGTGTFRQDWLSENTTYNLVLAKEAGSFGTYEMSGNLTVASKAEIGRSAQALFTQNGGSITVNESRRQDGGMSIGGSAGTTFMMNNGTLEVFGIEKLERGSFLQLDGFHQVSDTPAATGQLIIDSDGAGYVLTNGELRSTNVIVGDSGNGEFVQGGGIVSISSGLYLSESPGSFGTIKQVAGTLTTSVEQVGGLGAGRLILSGGDHTVQYNLLVGGNLNPDFTITTGAGGVVSMTNGTLTVGKEILHKTTYAFDDNAYKSAFDQSGGTHTVQNMLKIESGANYVLGGGSLSSLSAATEELYGSFTQTGGAHTVAGDMTITGTRADSGYNLIGGTHTVAGNLTITGETEYYFRGGTYTLGAGQQLSVGGLYNTWGFVEIGDGSSIQSGGGVIQNGSDAHAYSHILSTTGSGGLYNAIVNNYESIIVRGGDSDLKAFQVSGAIHNYRDATINIGLSSQPTSTGFHLIGDLHNYDGGKVLLDMGEMTVDGNIYNAGDIDVRTGLLLFTGTLHVQIGGVVYAHFSELSGGHLSLEGGFRVDPSIVRVGNSVVGETGYITATAGDQFFIGGDFINHSTQNTLWDTSLASLIFENAVPHDFYLAGLDLGAIADGFVDNFAWGSLSLADGAELRLFDGNLDTLGAALYLGLLAPMDLNDIYSEFNIYYNATLAGNAWLGNNRYALQYGGYLIPFLGGTEPPGPEPAPEPSTLALFGLGLAGLAGMRRKKLAA